MLIPGLRCAPSGLHIYVAAPRAVGGVAPQQIGLGAGTHAAQLEAQLAGLEVQKARDDKRFAQLQFERARVALERRTVRSPIDGIVTDRFLAAGEYVKERPILKIARIDPLRIDPLRVEVVLPAEQFGILRTGMRAEVTPALTGAKPQAAEITEVDPILDTASGMFRVSLRLPNSEHAIPGGVECTVRFASRQLPL